jgi:hypothetical protein
MAVEWSSASHVITIEHGAQWMLEGSWVASPSDVQSTLSTKNLELHKQAGELETKVKQLEAQLALVGKSVPRMF